MANTQKFLDEKGVQHLWSKISMEDYPNNETLIAVLNAIDQTKANKEEIPSKISQLENDAKFTTEIEVEALYKKLNSNTILGFYCIEDVTVVVNDISTVYPANSNVEIRLLSDDTFEIIPTSDNSIMSLSAFPGALGTYYSWLEGVKQFSNILFDMNHEDMYTKWSQGNQGAYQVQFAQYTNCIFWSDNPYISEVTKRTNYTLYYSAELPLCYSTIPENTFKAFYLAFNATIDPNWGNKVYRDSFAAATWATQVFSYYGARTIGIFGHDSPDFNITLPKDCRGLMFESTAIENAGTFDAINTTNFGAGNGSWREAFGYCSSLRNLYIKNLKANLNISWSPINYESIYFIISNAINTSKITITVSPYTYNLLSQSDFDLATEKNITITLSTANYIEDKRLAAIDNKADKNYVDEQIANLIDTAPGTLNTLGKLATAFQENDEVVEVLNDAIVTKADKTYVDNAIANIPTESDVLIVDCPDGSVISHTFDQIMTAINADKVVYISLYGTVLASLKYVADDNSFIEFSALRHQIAENQSNIWIDNININNDNSFSINKIDLSTNNNASTAILYTPQELTDAQKAQARANLGISENINSEPVITNYEYTYNGDTSDESYDWVLNGSGHKMYAKLGELPEGTMNIVGSEITVTNHTNSSLTVHFTVTEEHLTRELSMYDGAMVAQATQTGFTQILQSVGYYTDYSSVLCICTRPGKYIVSFGGWVEWVDFTETGVYGFETRTWGGNEYASHFTFTSTTGGSGGTSGTIGGTSSPVDYKGNEIQAFTRGICIGDSVTEGTLDHSGGTFNKAGTSYPAILKRLTGLDITNAGIAGATSKTWYDMSLNSSAGWGDWVNNEWFWREPTGTSLDYSGYDFAIIHLGINDVGNMGDITIDELLVDYEANMYNIINKLKENNNGIRIFLATIVPSYAPAYNETYKAMNNKIKAIVEATTNVYLLDLNDLSNLTMHSAYNVWHPTAIGYVKMAEEIKALISYTINQNLDDFKSIQFIGTDYTF